VTRSFSNREASDADPLLAASAWLPFTSAAGVHHRTKTAFYSLAERSGELKDAGQPATGLVRESLNALADALFPASVLCFAMSSMRLRASSLARRIGRIVADGRGGEEQARGDGPSEGAAGCDAQRVGLARSERADARSSAAATNSGQAVHARKVDVEDGDVRPLSDSGRHDLVAAFDVGDDLHVRMQVDERLELRPDDLLVLGEARQPAEASGRSAGAVVDHLEQHTRPPGRMSIRQVGGALRLSKLVVASRTAQPASTSQSARPTGLIMVEPRREKRRWRGNR
jgi:hypothetical protein